MKTDAELIQEHAKAEVIEAMRRVDAITNRMAIGKDLTYDEVNDAAAFLNAAASRLRP